MGGGTVTPDRYPDTCGGSSNTGVEKILKEQIAKVEELLETAAQKGHYNRKLKIQTACSGTDSPIIAAQILQDTLGAEKFTCKHDFSCEIEPWKQAYIYRNFGVRVYDDINTLWTPKARTAFGQEVPVTQGDMFIAGTVCKDFSGLRTHNLDLEDKGKSGETFFSAVQFMYHFGPKFCIFENVKGAPWIKMQEYITGEVQLQSIFDKDTSGKNQEKDPQDDKGSGKKNKITDMTFEVTEDGEVFAEAVPKHVGVRVGAKLLGFKRNGKYTTVIGDVDDFGSDARVIDALSEIGRGGPRKSINLKTIVKACGAKMQTEVMVFERLNPKFQYETQVLMVDSKEFGLPQTRQRGYMIAFRYDLMDETVKAKCTPQDLGNAYTEIMFQLQTPLEMSCEDMLQASNESCPKRLREMVRGPIGQNSRHDETAVPYFWTGDSKDMARNRNYRACKTTKGTNDTKERTNTHNLKGSIMTEYARNVTRWGPRNSIKLSPNDRMWPDLLQVMDGRMKDLIDAYSTRLAAMQPMRDPLHHRFVWDISQNVDMSNPTNAPGIVGCVTPGGWLYSLSVGRSFTGGEKLLLQGIPTDRLKLSGESEVQLGDLAGNAMSLPVINAAMLSVMGMQEYALRKAAKPKYVLPKPVDRKLGTVEEEDEEDEEEDGMDIEMTAPSSAAAKGEGTGNGAPVAGSEGDAAKVLLERMAPLAHDAMSSSILCVCETSGGVSPASLMVCQGCGYKVCRQCEPYFHLAVHAMTPLKGTSTRTVPNSETDPGSFERRLRQLVPLSMVLKSGASDGPLAKVDGASGMAGRNFKLVNVTRRHGCWELQYGATATSTDDRLIYEVRFTVGQLATGYKQKLGAMAQLFSYAPTIKGKRGTIAPCARIKLEVDRTAFLHASEGGECMPCDTSTAPPKGKGKREAEQGKSCSLLSSSSSAEVAAAVAAAAASMQWEVRANETKDSVEVSLGLTGRGGSQGYRSEMGLIKFANERVPGAIDVKSNAATTKAIGQDVSGTYRRLSCRGSAVFGLEYKNEEKDLYIYVLPDPVRIDIDRVVLANAPSYRDAASTVLVDFGVVSSEWGLVGKEADNYFKTKYEEKGVPGFFNKILPKPAYKTHDKIKDGMDAYENNPSEWVSWLTEFNDLGGEGDEDEMVKQNGSSSSSSQGKPPKKKARVQAGDGSSSSSSGSPDGGDNDEAVSEEKQIRGRVGVWTAAPAISFASKENETVASAPPLPSKLGADERVVFVEFENAKTKRLVDLARSAQANAKLIASSAMDYTSPSSSASSSSSSGGYEEEPEEEEEEDGMVVVHLVGPNGTQSTRRLVNEVGSSLQKFIASQEYKHNANFDTSVAWGTSVVQNPVRPAATWVEVKDKKSGEMVGYRMYNGEDSNALERAIRERDHKYGVWQVCASDDGRVVINARPGAAAHRAAHPLRRDEGDTANDIHATWHVVVDTDTQASTSDSSSFKVPSSKCFPEADQPALLNAAGLSLYPRQAQALHRMIEIESGAVPFNEKEHSEHELPGTNISLVAQVERENHLKGGVLADAMGGGKTVTTIALVAQGVAVRREREGCGRWRLASERADDEEEEEEEEGDLMEEEEEDDDFEPESSPSGKGNGKSAKSPAKSKAKAKAKGKGKGKDDGCVGPESAATLVAVPSHLLSQWRDEVTKFCGDNLCVIMIEDVKVLRQVPAEDLVNADIVLVPMDLLRHNDVIKGKQTGKGKDKKKAADKPNNYRGDLWKFAHEANSDVQSVAPMMPKKCGHLDHETLKGVWIPGHPAAPYAGNEGDQGIRDETAYFTHRYEQALEQIRSKVKSVHKQRKGVPLEWFRWERVVIDEVHEATCPDSGMVEEVDEKGKPMGKQKAINTQREKAIAGRELLGLAQLNPDKRPLRARGCVWGLTGTPLLTSEARVTELAAVAGGTYIAGGWRHWRMNERASGRDQFLNYMIKDASPLLAKEIRENCQDYVSTAIQRNRCEEFTGVEKIETITATRMDAEVNEAYLRVVARDTRYNGDEYNIKKSNMDPDIYSQVVQFVAKVPARQVELVARVRAIHAREPSTKMVVFAPAGEAFESAQEALAGMGALGAANPAFASLPVDDPRAEQEVINTFRHPDVIASDEANPRVLLLNFSQASGFNLQYASHDVILYSPLFNEADPISAVANEQQAIGRCFRLGATKAVTVHRIVVHGPNDEESVDDQILAFNTDQTNIVAAAGGD